MNTSCWQITYTSIEYSLSRFGYNFSANPKTETFKEYVENVEQKNGQFNYF